MRSWTTEYTCLLAHGSPARVLTTHCVQLGIWGTREFYSTVISSDRKPGESQLSCHSCCAHHSHGVVIAFHINQVCHSNIGASIGRTWECWKFGLPYQNQAAGLTPVKREFSLSTHSLLLDRTTTLSIPTPIEIPHTWQTHEWSSYTRRSHPATQRSIDES